MITQATPRFRSFSWVDLLVAGLLAAGVFAMISLARQWSGPYLHAPKIDLSLASLPAYTFYTFARGMIALVISLVFGVGYAYWAYTDRRASRLLLPLLDILQSIPVLGFLPGVVLALVALFPDSNFGVELACILMIFTAQAWNIAFSFYDTLQSIPDEMRSLARLYGYSRWETFARIELPAGIRGLTFNAIISMSAGWFLITVEESFTLGNVDFRLPGLGSYMAEAMNQSNLTAQIGGIAAMVGMIVAIDQLLFRPLIVWSQRYRFEDIQTAEPEHSRILDLLCRSRLLGRLASAFSRRDRVPVVAAPDPAPPLAARKNRLGATVYGAVLLVLIGVAGYGCAELLLLLAGVSAAEWGRIWWDFGCTALRVAAALALSLAWTVPVGVWIGLRPAWARFLQPLIQIAASFPAPMIYPLVIGVYLALGGTLQTGSVVLMMLGTQWYILFNVISAANAIPRDLLCAGDIFHLRGWNQWRTLLLPAIFPNLVTGIITASGGAWNTSIVAEYVAYKGQTLTATGIGALITEATNAGNYPLLAASVTVLALVVVLINRTLWRRLYAIATSRYTFNA